MNKDEAADVLMNQLAPKFRAQLTKCDAIDKWARWDHDDPFQPSESDPELKVLRSQAQTPWGLLVVASIAQGLFIDGYRTSSDEDSADVWRIWQANGFDKRQAGLFRAATTYGDAFTWTLPGVDAITGEAMPSIRGFSPREMIALFDDPIVDDWPEVAARFRTISPGKIKVTVLDDGNLHHFTADGHDLGDLKYVDSEVHGVGVCPVTVWENISDVDGRGYGEIEPIISVLRRLDQTKNDRLVVQQYASYVVKTISGIDIPEGEAKKAHIKLSAKKMLTSDSTEAKFGSLPASPLEPFNQSYEADLRDLSAVTQLPPHTFLGALVNLSAEALAAASAGEAAKRDERQHSYGESAERNLRLAAAIAGNTDAAADYESRVIWKDTTIRSLAQVADALGKLANGLGFPPQLLWNRIPNVTQQEIAEALDLIKEQDVVTRALAEMAAGQTSPEAPIPEAA